MFISKTNQLVDYRLMYIRWTTYGLVPEHPDLAVEDDGASDPGRDVDLIQVVLEVGRVLAQGQVDLGLDHLLDPRDITAVILKNLKQKIKNCTRLIFKNELLVVILFH